MDAGPARPHVTGAAQPGQGQWRRGVPAAVAWLLRLSAVIAFLSLLSPAGGEHEDGRFDVIGDGVSFAAAMASAGTMLLVAGALRRRSRRAWVLAVAVVALGALAHLQNGRYTVTAVYAVVLAALVWARADFTARSQRRSRLAAVRVLLWMSGSSLVAGMLLAARAAPENSLADRFVEVFFGLLGFAPQLRFREPALSELTQIALTTMGALTALLTLVALLAPPRKPPVRTADDEQRLRTLLDRFGQRDSLGYFALRSDKSVIFSPSGKAAVAYRVIGGVSLASGDPIGDYEAWPGAIEAWLCEADNYGWVPGVVGASEEAALVLDRFGLDALELGDEAVIELSDFSLEGRPMRGGPAGGQPGAPGRLHLPGEPAARVERGGDRGDPRRCRPVPRGRGGTGLLDGAGPPRRPGGRPRADPRTGPGRGEAPRRRPRLRALGARGAFAGPDAPGPGQRERDDRVRRGRGGRGRALLAGRADLAELRRLPGRVRPRLQGGAGPVLRIWLRILLLVSRWFQVESLYRSNAKYRPSWSPRFVCFRRGVDLPRVAIAALEAEAFLARPRLPTWISTRIYR